MEVLLDGPQVAEFHCEICLENDQCYLTPLYDITDDHFETSMNGKLVREKTSLEQGSRIWIGTSYVFKFFDPSQPPPDFPVNYKMAYTVRTRPRQLNFLQRSKLMTSETMQEKKFLCTMLSYLIFISLHSIVYFDSDKRNC